MPHNENYLHNILWQRLQDYHPAGEGSGEGACPSPEKNYAIQVKLLTSCKDTVHNLVYISTAGKTTCERIPPSKRFLGAVYNHRRLYSDYVLYWAELVSISAQ